jgi:transcriptional regulator with XRE-family HTH domain
MDEQQVGRNIRGIRSSAGLTLTALAAGASVTKSTLSKIENGQVSAPISTLMRVAKALNVPLADFFYEAEKDPDYVLTRKGAGKIVHGNGTKLGYSYEGLALEKKDTLIDPFVLTIDPEDPPGEFYHEGQEFIYMLSGILEFSIGDDVLELHTGDSLLFNSGITHKTHNAGDTPARFLCIFIQKPKKKTTGEGA